ncbi:MAG: 2-oxo acid dehydrogenase subunit E2 [Betaproteobacteria bacterium]|nr:2-oxo acid dehydrogenase subunit E2 [Betaproteobacteria bacterium]
MPSLGADMEAGTLVAWNVMPGDAVKRGQVVAVVETQKGAIDVEIWQDGTVEKLVVEPGEKVPVGAVLATLIAEGEPAPAAVVPEKEVAVAAPQAAVARPQPAAIPGRFRISPAARKLAEELGVNIDALTPAAADGVISRADVERAAQAAKAGAPPKPGDWQSQMRKAIAAAMAKSKREIPHYYLGTGIEMTRALAWLERENAARPVTARMLYAVLLIKAVALALREVPELNGFWIDGAFQPGPGIHVGMAVAMRGGGLVAPAIHDADRKSLAQLMDDLRDLITRVRGGRLKSSEMADPTITLTSLGDLGVETVYGVIYPPQVALIGFGRISERAWAENGVVACRRAVTASLAADHRASDGHRGAVFLAAVNRLLQEPEQLQ